MVPPIVDRVDVDDVVDRIDVDEVVGRIDVDALLDRIDVNALLDRVDPNRLLDRVDPNRLLDRVDVNELVERTELGAIIARSTSGVFTRLVDLARVQVIAVDQVVHGVPAHIRRRREVPGRPGKPHDTPELPRADRWRRASLLQGHFAGTVSRFLAFVVDQFVLANLYAIGTMLVGAALQVVVGRSLDLTDQRWLVTASYALWSFAYVAGQLAVSGRTFGKALLGLTVVRADGGELEGRRAALRTLVFPVSFVLFGLGFLIGLVRQDRRQLHDLVAGTAVIYDWDAEVARTRAAPVGAGRRSGP